jgi:hypothetical protein
MSSRVTGRSLSPRVKRSRVAPVSTWIFQGSAELPDHEAGSGRPVTGEDKDMHYTGQHRFYCDVDRHARTLFTHVLDHQGKTVFERDLPTGPAVFLDALAPFRPDLVVGAEGLFAGYWLADLCEDHQIPFALGHASGCGGSTGARRKPPRSTRPSWRPSSAAAGSRSGIGDAPAAQPGRDQRVERLDRQLGLLVELVPVPTDGNEGVTRDAPLERHGIASNGVAFVDPGFHPPGERSTGRKGLGNDPGAGPGRFHFRMGPGELCDRTRF